MRKTLWLLVVSIVALVAPKADAAITFDFNSLGSGVTNGSLDTYMENLIGGLGGTDVTIAGGVTDKTYTGDGHVTGNIESYPSPTMSNPNRIRYRFEMVSLGTTDGYDVGDPVNIATPIVYDTYLVNKDSTDRIVMQFDFPVYQISFDYEIFPNGDCPATDTNPAGGTCTSTPLTSNWPDFKFNADGVEYFKTIGIVPGQAGTFQSSSVNTTSGIGNTELAPQFIGTSGLYTFQNGAYKFEFIDWPSRIGIDNLKICTDSNECLPPPPPPVIPEPASLFLMGTGLAGVIGVNRRRKS